MQSRYRILSFHYIPNNGAFLFTYALADLFRRSFPAAQVKVLDYRSPRLWFFEVLKRYKFTQAIPSFYWRRAQIWGNLIEQKLDLEKRFPHFASAGKLQRYFSDHYDALIVGMDVWCLTRGTERPLFPNIYWLPEKMAAVKIAYGVSAYNSDSSLLQRHEAEIASAINDFAVIGARDRFTHEMVARYRTREGGLVDKVPDPTWCYEIKPTGLRAKLSRLGLDLDRPILGILLYGHQALSQAIRNHYRSKGYQVVALSMYNPCADINLGHVLDPFEWAESFRLLSFCITDRFHGTIFCIKNQIPFLSIEKDTHLPVSQSKLVDLLSDFDLNACYANPQAAGFSIPQFLSAAGEIESHWDGSLAKAIPAKIEALQDRHQDFIGRMKISLAQK